MAISLDAIRRGKSKQPPIITVYGDGGIGKTTFAANAPDPIFIFTENGLGDLDVERFSYSNPDGSEREVATSFEEVMFSIDSLITSDHSYKTLVIDSLDWLEGLVEKYLLRIRPTTEKGRPVKNIKDYGYNMGEKFIIDYWNEYFELIGDLRKKKDMMIIQISHRDVIRVTPPDSEAYTAYNIKLTKGAREKIIEHSDIVLFANTRTVVTKEDVGFNQERGRAYGSGERNVFTEERPAHEGKNRYSLPYQIPVKDKEWASVWMVLCQHVPWFTQFIPQDAVTEQPQAETASQQTQATGA